MHYKTFLSMLPFVVLFACAVGAGYLFFLLVKHRQRAGRAVFLRQLLHGPGESTRQKLFVIQDKLDFYLYLLVLTVPYLAVILAIRQDMSPVSFWPLTWPTILQCVLIVAPFLFLIVEIRRLLAEQRDCSFALDCEMLVGQELNMLMRQDCIVFHDVPGDGFTIDHVLVSPAGVYAIATKGRVKPKKGRGVLEGRVFYDGKVLTFPGWSESGPLVQIKWQVAWFAEWLSGVMGETVGVKGIIFLPGWIVETGGRNEISIVNETNVPLLGRPRGEVILDEEIRQRIACQIEQRCRTMAG